jgi:TonB family protein
MRNGDRVGSRHAGWMFGLLASVVGHVCVLCGLFVVGRRVPVAEAAVEPIPDTISVTPIETASLGAPPLDDPPRADDPALPFERPWDAPMGDRDNPVAVTVAPAVADGQLKLAPAPDQGDAGTRVPVHAYRRDRSELHARLSDGADEPQPSRMRTSHHTASRQAIRREPEVGLGDSTRTTVPTHAARPAAIGNAAVSAETAAGDDALKAGAANSAAASTAAAAAAWAELHRFGPLDAEAGRRSFDNDRAGAAADNQALRAASNELNPGRTDFSRPAAIAPTGGTTGAGPGAAPGAVSHPSSGSAPQALGARDPRAAGSDVSERTLDRRYERYLLEIQQRVNRIREFPKALALRLEQGETIVRFVVGVDGRLGEGPYVVKSSGFEEFDGAAVRAVRRAAPFPPMPDPANARPQSFSLRVMFDNPVVR